MAEIVVTLTWFEVGLAAWVGCLRQITNLRDGRADRYGAAKGVEGFTSHITGCMGEIAVAKHFGIYWCGSLGNLKAADVGKLQVRATPRPLGNLCVHEPVERNGRKADNPADYFVCARVVSLPDVRLVGWMIGRDAQIPRYWKTLPGHPDRPAYFVDNNDLRPMSELTLPLAPPDFAKAG